MDREQREGFTELAAGSIKVQVREEGQFGMRGLVLYPSQDGPTIFDGEQRHAANQLDLDAVRTVGLAAGPSHP